VTLLGGQGQDGGAASGSVEYRGPHAQVKVLLLKGQAVALRDKGITELPLVRLNARLAPQRYVIRNRKGQGVKRLVVCTGEDGWVAQFRLFELRQVRLRAS
jgi:hypothetical protein